MQLKAIKAYHAISAAFILFDGTYATDETK